MRHLSWKFSASTRFCVILLMVLHLHSLELEIFDLGDENKEIKHMKCGKLNGSEEYHCLPSFIIAGTQKSGTTALAAFLSEHNEISFSRRKEVHFFDKTSTYNKGIEEYIKAFRPWDPSSSAGRNPPLYGEATPFYLASRLACKRMAKQLGKGVKIIVMLREPTARAYSEYQMKKRRVEEQNDFLLLLQQHQSELHECMVAHPKSITAIGKCVPQVLRNHSRWDKLKTAWKKTFDKSKNWDDVVHSCFPIESPKQSEPIPALTAQPTAHRLGEGHTGGCTGSWKMPMTFGSPYLASRPLCNCDTACICGEQNVAPGWIIAAPSLNHCQNDCAFLGSPGLCYHSIGRNISESTESCSKDHRVQPLDPSFELRHSDATVPSQGGNAALLSVSPPLRGSTSMYLPDLSVGNQVESTSGVQQQHHPKFDGKKSGLSNGGSTSVNGSNQKKPLSSAKDLDALVMPRFDAESCWSNHHEGFEKLKSLHAAFVEEIEHFEHCAVNKAATNYCDLGSEIEEGVAAVVGNGNDIDNILEIIDKEKKEDKPPSPPYDIAAAPSDLDIPIVEADASHDSGSARKKIEKEKGKTKKEEGCLTSAQYLSFLNAFEEASRQGSPKTSTSALGTLRSPFKGTDAYATSASGGSGGSGGSAQVEVGWEGSKQNSAVASWFGLNVSEVLASLDYTVNQCLRVRSGISTQYFYRSMYAVQLHHCFQWIPPSQFLIIPGEQLRRQPLSVLTEVLTFLGLHTPAVDPAVDSGYDSARGPDSHGSPGSELDVHVGSAVHSRPIVVQNSDEVPTTQTNDDLREGGSIVIEEEDRTKKDTKTEKSTDSTFLAERMVSKHFPKFERSTGWRARSEYEQLPAEIQQRLEDFFAPHNQLLTLLLGRDFNGLW